MSGTIAAVEWQARLRSLIYAQYAQTLWAPGIANAIGVGANGVEAASLALMYLFSIDTITSDATNVGYGIGRGVQLDKIGKLVGQPRGAASDDTYRLILHARIAANRSWGAGDNVINVFLAMFAGAGTPLLIRGWIGQFTVRLVGVLMPPLVVSSALALLAAATQSGQRAVLEYMTTDSAHAFTFGALGAHQGFGDPTFGRDVGGMLGGAQSI